MRAILIPLILLLSSAAFADIPKPATLSDTLDLMLEHIRPSYPDAYIDVVNQNIVLAPNSESVMNPDNIHSVLRNIDNGADREAALDGFITTLISAFAEDPIDGALPLDSIYPVVRHESFAQTPGGTGLSYKPFIGDMVQVYAIDYPDYVAYVTLDNFDDGLTEDTLHIVAAQNLTRKINITTVEQDGAFFFLVADGFYESSLILNAPLWDNIAAQIGGDIAMIVPARDTVIFTGATDDDTLATLGQIRDDILRDGSHPLSALTYIWQDRAWQGVLN